MWSRLLKSQHGWSFASPSRYLLIEVIPARIGRYDEKLGWSLKPGVTGKSIRTGELIEYRINELGLRDDETTYDKPNGVLRIVIVGDSNTFGYGVTIRKHFTWLLEGYFDRVQVINLGVAGYGIDQELMRLRRRGLSL